MSDQQATNLTAKLKASVGEEEPVLLSPSELKLLRAADVPKNVQIEVGVVKNGITHVEFDGRLMRGQKTPFIAEVQTSWYRKHWNGSLGMSRYLDLFQRAVEIRQRTRGDAEFGELEDDGAWIHFSYRVFPSADDLAKAYAQVLRIKTELREVADAVSHDVDARVARAAQSMSGWGKLSLEKLVDQVDRQKTTDAKGRVLEELSSKLFATVPGFRVTGRFRTETEEIDLQILNGSRDPVWGKESALLLAECKNWSSKCGKNEFVLFKEKLGEGNRRCSCGFLISWNGFAKTVTKEMLRSSRSEMMIVLIDGTQLRRAVREKNFPDLLQRLWRETTLL
jgi:hypothetical protein